MKHTKALRRIVQQLMADPTKKWYGFDLMRASHCFSGTLYVNLDRMENEGWIYGEFEEGGPADKPRRRIYTVTEKGRQAMKVLT
jgi:PadR family transcriptional regulator